MSGKCEACGDTSLDPQRQEIPGRLLCAFCQADQLYPPRPSRAHAHASLSNNNRPLSPRCQPSLDPHTSFLLPNASGKWSGDEDEELSEVTWALREYDARRLDPVVIVLVLPGNASWVDQQVTAFFALVYGLRLRLGLTWPVPFAVAWVGEHIGLHPRAVSRSLEVLGPGPRYATADDVLVRGTPLPPKKGRRLGTNVFLPNPARCDLPAGALPVQADRSGGVEQHDKSAEFSAVDAAEADDAREVLERRGGVAAAGHPASGDGRVGHRSDATSGDGGARSTR